MSNRSLKIFGTDVINIFCDASIINCNGITYGCPGSIVVYNNQVIHSDSTILVESTNNESEIYAIMLATKQAILYNDNCKRLNIFSDSKISVSGLREWMPAWVKRSKDGILMSTSGEVANQQIFLHITNMILTYLDEYHLYHIDGHCTNNRDIIKAVNDFYKFNKRTITFEEASYLCIYNNFVDNMTRKKLEDNLSYLPSLTRLTPAFIYPILSESDLSRLYSEIFDN